MSVPVASVGVFKKIVALEMLILQRGNEINAVEAQKFFDCLLSYRRDYANIQNVYWSREPNQGSLCNDQRYGTVFHRAYFVEKKIKRLLDWLSRFLESTKSLENIDQNDNNVKLSAAISLDSLLQKQKFYIQMIDSLEPESKLSAKEAEIRYEHVSQAYEKFVLNQGEISILVKDTAFDDQVNIFREIQGKVLFLQKTLKDISSSIEPVPLPVSNIDEHFNRTESPQRKSIIQKIEPIELKKDLGAKEGDTSSNCVSPHHQSSIKNNVRIETDVNDATLDEEFKTSIEINEKEVSFQTKVEEISSLVVSPSSIESQQMNESYKVAHLNLLLEKQETLIDDIKSVPSFGKTDTPKSSREEAKQSLKLLLELKREFFTNQRKIEELVTEVFDLYQQRKISTQIQSTCTRMEKELEEFLSNGWYRIE